ncbi:MAG: RsmB/NOP family class I SAM-dependent RNA methyltransferase [Tannerella sp.]|nr:RsmB/NOP family class I SAM-dependent RNA methyltransferase [Tannerella sp.]
MFPDEFIIRTKGLLRDEYEALESALESQPPVSFRINPHKFPACLPHDPLYPAGNAPAGHEKVPWCETGYYLPQRPSFTSDPLFHAGAYYVQEASSMFLEQVLAGVVADAESSRKRLMALDLCAAPGGKSTHLLSLLPRGSLLVSNEVIRSRSAILAENMTKWGWAGHITTSNDPKDFGKLKHAFDIILADLPCSGEGMFRKDPAGRSEWSVNGVKLCASRQRRIVRDAWDALKPGGLLIYSTCTFNTEENEDNVYALALETGAEIVPVAVKPEWNIAGALRHGIPACRFFPHRTRGEGFFIAAMRKNDSEETANGRRPPRHAQRGGPTATVPAEIKNMLSNPDRFRFFTGESFASGNAGGGFASGNAAVGHPSAGCVYALPEDVHAGIRAVRAETLNIISAGVLLGRFRGKDFAPSASLALSAEINRASFPSVELSCENAMRYLQRETVALPGNTPGGYILATCKNTPLGFMKNIGNRANNLYPPEWRVRRKIV